MVGDSQIGKTSLMVKYVEGSFDEDYIQTLVLSKALDIKCTIPEIDEVGAPILEYINT
ncbi:11898_t:CDS:2 [Entrophospora sp. SA101]|nr:11898_t:CDS:2 [Entrophospora sp. SA101]